MRKKFILLCAALLACVVLFASCAAKDMAPAESMDYYVEDAIDGDATYRLASGESANAPDPNSPEETPAPSAAAGRKLVKNITAEVETLEFDAYLQAVEAKAAALGGYVHSKETRDYGYNEPRAALTRRASLVLRIPAQSLDEFEGSLGKLGRVTSIDESVRDETMSYYDIAAHIEALEVERDALLGLMAKAKDLKDLLLLQERVTAVRSQLNAFEGQLRVLSDQVALSTVTLTVTEVGKLSPAPSEGWFARTWNGFKNSVRGVVRGLGGFLSGLVIALPYLVVIGIPAGLVIFLVLRRRRKKGKGQP
ncbi:MAG: DUF4349 domain-containing protein [Oscillospiraceae bacterium]|nr:DUF4349 domain-containing protein [Oscillospiraceae bacterium]